MLCPPRPRCENIFVGGGGTCPRQLYGAGAYGVRFSVTFRLIFKSMLSATSTSTAGSSVSASRISCIYVCTLWRRTNTFDVIWGCDRRKPVLFTFQAWTCSLLDVKRGKGAEVSLSSSRMNGICSSFLAIGLPPTEELLQISPHHIAGLHSHTNFSLRSFPLEHLYSLCISLVNYVPFNLLLVKYKVSYRIEKPVNLPVKPVKTTRITTPNVFRPKPNVSGR